MKEKKEQVKKISEEKVSTPDKRTRLLKGIVFGDKMDKTVSVLVNRYKKHSKYKKRYKVSKKYKAHDEKNEYKKGDRIIIQECRPVSKDKQWKVKSLIK